MSRSFNIVVAADNWSVALASCEADLVQANVVTAGLFRDTLRAVRQKAVKPFLAKLRELLAAVKHAAKRFVYLSGTKKGFMLQAGAAWDSFWSWHTLVMFTTYAIAISLSATGFIVPAAAVVIGMLIHAIYVTHKDWKKLKAEADKSMEEDGWSPKQKAVMKRTDENVQKLLDTAKKHNIEVA